MNDLRWWPAAVGGAAVVAWLGSGSLRYAGVAAIIAVLVSALWTLLRWRERTQPARKQQKILAPLDREAEKYLADKAPDLTMPGGGLQ